MCDLSNRVGLLGHRFGCTLGFHQLDANLVGLVDDVLEGLTQEVEYILEVGYHRFMLNAMGLANASEYGFADELGSGFGYSFGNCDPGDRVDCILVVNRHRCIP